MLAALSPGAETVAKAGLTIVESSILGAITVLAIGVAIFAVWKLGRVQETRVSDLQRMSSQMEGYIRESQTAVNGFTNAIQSLTSAEKETSQLLAQLNWSINNIVKEAVRSSKYARSYSPETGIPQQGKPRGG